MDVKMYLAGASGTLLRGVSPRHKRRKEGCLSLILMAKNIDEKLHFPVICQYINRISRRGLQCCT